MFAELEAEAKQAIDQDPVVGDEIDEIGVEVEIGIDRALGDNPTVAPFIAD